VGIQLCQRRRKLIAASGERGELDVLFLDVAPGGVGPGRGG
jgi:hypothetical protein